MHRGIHALSHVRLDIGDRVILLFCSGARHLLQGQVQCRSCADDFGRLQSNCATGRCRGSRCPLLHTAQGSVRPQDHIGWPAPAASHDVQDHLLFDAGAGCGRPHSARRQPGCPLCERLFQGGMLMRQILPSQRHKLSSCTSTALSLWDGFLC